MSGERPSLERCREVLAAGHINGKPIKHGRVTTYNWWRCPCDLCRAANTAYHRGYRARKEAASV